MRRYLLLLFCITVFCGNSKADQIVLENGDRLTGTVIKSDEKELVINTTYAGQVTVQWAAVQSLSSTTPLHFQLRDGRTLSGRVVAADGTWKLEQRNGEAIPVSKPEVARIRNEAEQVAYDQAQNPGWRQNWEGGTNIGFALTRGNSESKNLALSFTADRKTLHDKLGLYANSVYATNDAPGAVPSITANAIRGGTRYDHDLTRRLFAFAGADFATAIRLLPGSDRPWGIPRHIRFWHGDQDQQVVGMAELSERRLCNEPSPWQKEKRCHLYDGLERVVHPAYRVGQMKTLGSAS